MRKSRISFWHVFDQLVDAALIMQRGGDPFVDLPNAERCKEIVHKDLHLDNIFVKPLQEGFLGNDSQLDDRSPGKRSLATFPKDAYPNVALADFDTALFDLHDGEDEYQDNPLHYIMGSRPVDALASKHPPEAFWSGNNVNKPIKFTSASDVWGIGAIMWNLATISLIITTISRRFTTTRAVIGVQKPLSITSTTVFRNRGA